MVLGKIEITQDTYLVGIGVSPGIAIGEVCLLNHQPRVVEWHIDEYEVEGELERFSLALEQAKLQLRFLTMRCWFSRRSKKSESESMPRVP